MKVHPEFVPEIGWCLGELVASSLRELKAKLPEGTVIEGYQEGMTGMVTPIVAPAKKPKPYVPDQTPTSKATRNQNKKYSPIPHSEWQKPRPWTPEMLQQARQLLAQGMTGGQAANELGVSRSSLLGAINRHGR